MKQPVLLIFIFLLFSIQTSACSCLSLWNDSFSRTAKNSEFVALIKIISFDEYLSDTPLRGNEKMPYSLTAEIIKKYKGIERKNTIKIYGDDGILCRKYLSEFRLNHYYLIAPSTIGKQGSNAYEFFSCNTNYLPVNISQNKAFGKYSLLRNQIDLDTFQNKIKYGDWDLVFILAFLVSVILFIIRMKNQARINTSVNYK